MAIASLEAWTWGRRTRGLPKAVDEGWFRMDYDVVGGSSSTRRDVVMEVK